MKTNYINQFKRDILVGEDGSRNTGMSLETVQPNGKTVKENIKEYFDSKTPDEIVKDMGLTNTPIVEDVSMEDAAKQYKSKIIVSGTGFEDVDFKAGWQQREQQLIPIIKELGEALKGLIDWSAHLPIIANDELVAAKTTLDKYKNYL